MIDKEKILEGNKLIAEFMCFVKDGFLWKHGDVKLAQHYPKHIFEGDNTDSFKFYSSWDWLMPVVIKIENLNLADYMYQWEGSEGETRYNFKKITVDIENNYCWIFIDLDLDPPHDICNHMADTKIEATWLCVVDFIKVYNERWAKEQ